MAIKYAKGEILAFIDDDAYPTKDWLKYALENFKDEDVAAVVGPAITAPEDALRQKASGVIFSSVLVSGRYNYRYLPKKKMTVDDYPSCNFLVRKQIMQELGGFNTKFWPGEDTKLCLDITRKLGRKIIYDPGVLVYHHRRPLFIPHLKQVANYSLHRGYFVKKYPATSLRLPFFIPTLFLCALICGGPLSLISAPLRSIYFSGVFLYLALVLFFSIHKDLRLIPLVFFGTILTHLTYGLYFLKGLFSKKLKEE
jgi:GT2 family glycosyltransferase